MASLLHDIQLDEASYVDLLRKIIGVSEKMQNAPSLGLIPQVNLVSDIVLAELQPYNKTNGGYLTVERVEFVAGRGNAYQHPDFAHSERTVAFVGSHMDVVPSNPEGWERDPFTLTVEGDNLYGRGTTDCLGHVALMTELFKGLSQKKVSIETKVVCVLIASEENSKIPGATGKLFHSGLPNLGINGIELGMDALTKIQERFYKDFGPLPQEKEYNYSCPSTMKPTKIESSTNGLNQIPPWVKITGGLIAKLHSYVDDLNANITSLEGKRGPVSKYTLPEESWSGKLELTFAKHYLEGIACSLESVGYKHAPSFLHHNLCTTDFNMRILHFKVVACCYRRCARRG
ncbi:uncharacterized protein PITG_05858 [Phytophthora infestans T30-4]|uniref:Uncharacterized protein n=1 Tax=Phytophthora infestans (strain T30-4) TaxID=403677 RepID=D0N5V1_PHYIT|nr:uncharacterized protein PITG_05858 [Phytophthora infestans T30-4]EEY70442.1 conserved hypothetical protein [Phytophthora infestans T30-4]|eukprot:XP_002998096.1 conserved hypothetical protein [Phytophthora infestans T30-4]